jgi:hypothetical protein
MNEKQQIGKIMKVLRNNNVIIRRINQEINPDTFPLDDTSNFLNKIKPFMSISNNLKNNNNKEQINLKKYEDNPDFKMTDDIVDNYIYQELIDKLDNRIKLIDDIIIPLVTNTIAIIFIFTILYISYLEIII